MTANNDALPQRLLRVAGELRGDNAQELIGLLNEAAAAIRALSADRGEAVAVMVDAGDGMQTPKVQWLSAGYRAPIGTRLYAATPPSPDCGEAGHAENRCGNAECLPSAAQSQVSDAERLKVGMALVNWNRRNGAENVVIKIGMEMEVAGQAIDAMQPQPGRVEGMDDRFRKNGFQEG